MSDFVEKLPKNEPIAFVVGAVAVGNPGKESFFSNSKFFSYRN